MQTSTTKVLALLMAVAMLTPMAGIAGAQEQPAANIPDGADAAVNFSDQTTTGTTVTVDEVNTTDGGFVVIHNVSLLEGEVIGSVIGVSQYLEPGMNENVTVTLFDVPGQEFNRTELTENETLIAMPHEDSNDNETYDFVTTNGSEDGPYLVNQTAVTDSANVTVVEEPPTTGESFTVANLTAPAVVEQGDQVEVTATIENPNDVADTQTVEYRFDGDVLVREQVSLEAEESTTFSTVLNTSQQDLGLSIHGLYTRDRGQPAQIRIAEEIESFDVSNLTAPERVSVGEEVTVNATVTNTNDFAIAEDIQYRFDGERVDSRNVFLEGGESATVEFEIGTEELTPGPHIYSVFSNDFGESALITVDAADDDDSDEMDGDDSDEMDGDDSDEMDDGDSDEMDGDDSDEMDGDDSDEMDGDDSDEMDDDEEEDETDEDETTEEETTESEATETETTETESDS